MGATCGTMKKARSLYQSKKQVRIGGRNIVSSKRIDPTKSKGLEDIDPA
jgi:hypothetical protein